MDAISPSRVLSPRAVKAWSRIHKWSSLVSTVFLLMLCITGLPLIFHEEVDHWLGADVVTRAMPADTPRLSADRIVEIARRRVPGKAVHFVIPDDDDPFWWVSFGSTAASIDLTDVVSVDARTGDVLRVAETFHGAFTAFLLKLHKELFADEIGSWILCAVGLIFLLSVVSGVVVYAPFMRRLAFGTVRRARGARLTWLDLHNLAGIVLTLWLVVVGGTGVVNTLSRQVFRQWMRTDVAEMMSHWRGQPTPDHLAGPQRAIDEAVKAAPGMELSSIAMPGTLFAGPNHYMAFFRGATPLQRRIVKPVLLDAATGSVVDTRELPLYAKAFFVSQPLHFGDYGGLPLKIVWAILDVVTIAVLGSGLYLWVVRRRRGLTMEADPELVQAALTQPAAE